MATGGADGAEVPAPGFSVGQRVAVASREGVVRFAGTTKFAGGQWVGVELLTEHGKNDGSVQGVKYFTCPPQHGIFVRPQMVAALNGDSPKTPSRRKSVDGLLPPKAGEDGLLTPVGGARRPSRSQMAAASAPPGPSSPRGAGAAKSGAAAAASPKAAPQPKAPAAEAAQQPVAKANGAAAAAQQPAPKATAAPQQPAAKAAAAPQATVLAQAAAAPAAKAAAPPVAAPQPAAAAPPQAAKAAAGARAAAALAVELPAALGEELRDLRGKVATLNQDVVRAQGELSKARQRVSELQEASDRYNALFEADVEMQEYKAAMDSLERRKAVMATVKSGFAQRQKEIGVLSRIKMALLSAASDQGEEQLARQLQVDAMARTLAEGRLEDAQLELADLELQLEQLADERARAVCKSELPAKAAEYQEVLRALCAASSRETEELGRAVTDLDKSTAGVTALRQDEQELLRECQRLQELIAEEEAQGEAFARLVQADGQLGGAHADVEAELFQGLEVSEKRLQQLEGLIERLRQEWTEAESGIQADNARAEELVLQVRRSAPGADPKKDQADAIARHAGNAALRLRQTRLLLGKHSSIGRSTAFQDCISCTSAMKGLLAKGDGAAADATAAGVVACKAGVIAVERLFWQADALGLHAVCGALGALAPQTKDALWHAQLCIEGCRCALAAACVIEALQLVERDVSAEVAAFRAAHRDLELYQVEKMFEAAKSTGHLERQPLDALVALERHLRKLRSSLGVDVGDARSCTSCLSAAFLVRRLEAAFRYGLCAGLPATAQDAEQWKEIVRSLSSLARRMHEHGLAALFSGFRGEHEQQWLPRELTENLATCEAAMSSGGGSSAAQALSTAAPRILPLLGRVNGSLRSLGASRARAKPDGRGWVLCCAGVQRDTAESFGVQQEVRTTTARVEEKQHVLDDIEGKLGEVSMRLAFLQEVMAPILENAEKARALNAEAERLRGEIGGPAAAQAALVRELDQISGQRAEHEIALEEVTRIRDKMKASLASKGGKPQGVEGLATIQELTTLRHISGKTARDLYGLQVSQISCLATLPCAAQRPPEAKGQPGVGAGVRKYAELRKDLVMEWAKVRLPVLASAAPRKPSEHAAAGADTVRRVERLQHLHFRLHSVRQALGPALEAVSVPEKVPSPALAANGPAVVDVCLDLQCPKWVRIGGAQLAFDFGDLCGVHKVLL